MDVTVEVSNILGEAKAWPFFFIGKMQDSAEEALYKRGTRDSILCWHGENIHVWERDGTYYLIGKHQLRPVLLRRIHEEVDPLELLAGI